MWNMIDIRLALVEGIDGKALIPLSNLILSYVMHHRNIGAVELWPDKITYSKFMITREKMLYSQNNFECRNKIIYYTGLAKQELLYGQAGIMLMNILYHLKSGYVSKFEV